MKKLKNISALLLGAVMGLTSLFTGAVGTFAATDVTLKGVWYESIYMEFNGSAASYNAYCKKTGAESYTKVDDELLRKVSGKYRLDIPGLAGNTSYDVKVVPVVNGAESEAEAITYTATPKAYDRSGFAFSSSDCPGAYNSDGTVAEGALILYVTNDNKDNVYNKKSLTSILSGLNSINSGKPVIIRIMDEITPIGSTKSAGMWKNTCGVTIEGIGPKAALNGWGISSGNNTDTEFRNLTFIDYTEDAIGFQEAKRLWVHNNTFYSGYDPKDSTAERDKLHGDGSCDLRECDDVTVSYNLFDGTDKTSLIGSSSSSRESTGDITFHHNFFNKTQQRTPRMRWHNLHAYNNYYYYTGAYGIGATCNTSVFAENNYFENASSPFLTSSQGGYASKFSDNDGGVIKAYGNILDNCYETVEGVDYFNAPSREYRMTADDFTTLKGGYTYNNFDASGYIANNAYNLQSADQARDDVINNAGRLTATNIYALSPVTPPTIEGEPVSVFYYDAPTSGTTGTNYGGINGEGTYFKGGNAACTAVSASGYRDAVKYNYSGALTGGSAISFTTKGPAVFTIIASTSGNTPVRMELTNSSNPDSVYHGTFQTGNKGNDVLSQINVLEAGTYTFSPSSAVSIYYMEVAEYDESAYVPVQTTTEATTVSASVSETTTEATTSSQQESTTEATTSAYSVAVKSSVSVSPEGEAVEGVNYVEYRPSTNDYKLVDTSSTYATVWTNEFTPVSTGRVVIKGYATPTTANGKWAFVQIKGKNAAGEEADIASLASDSSKNIALRTRKNGAEVYSSSSEAIGANTVYNYEFDIDLDAKTVVLNVNGKTFTADIDVSQLSNVYMITAVSDTKRSLIANLPSVEVMSDEAVLLGDVNRDGVVDSKDASIILAIASGSVENDPVGDVNNDGVTDSKDASLVLQYTAGIIAGF
ncbi:MAG: hypothetical protein IJS61_05140 [Firmicutes bacterium]|nr:hypothetical protein [Bacillota bacterium]